MTHEYVAERAELYALGALDDDERRAIEAHLRECSSCAQVVGAAERDVALIASMEAHRAAPPELAARIERTIRPQRSAWPLAYALAAALLVGLLPSAYFWSENRRIHATMLAQNAVMERLAGAPHRMTKFHPMQAGPAADVVYAPDGSWYLVVVRGRGQSARRCVDARRRAHDARQGSPARQSCDALPAEESSDGSARAHGWRPGRRRSYSVMAKKRSKSSRRSIRVAGGSAERIVAP